jgi:hypothetical protein
MYSLVRDMERDILVLMKEGKVFKDQDYFDNTIFMKQLGLM